MTIESIKDAGIKIVKKDQNNEIIKKVKNLKYGKWHKNYTPITKSLAANTPVICGRLKSKN